jgi:hypothetical protein
MAFPKEEKVEEKVKETGAPTDDSEPSDADFERVSGGVGGACVPHCTTLSV